MKEIIFICSISATLVSCAGAPAKSSNINTSNTNVDFNCYQNGKKFSHGSEYIIGGVKKKCRLGSWSAPNTADNKNTYKTSNLLIESLDDDSELNIPNTCIYANTKYSSGATLTIQGVQKTCTWGSWKSKKELKELKETSRKVNEIFAN